MDLPQKIRTLRKKKGMSQLEMAEALNVSRQAISGWEAGTSKPSIENLKYLSDFYDVSLDWLCSEDDTDDITDGKKKHLSMSMRDQKTMRVNQEIIDGTRYGY